MHLARIMALTAALLVGSGSGVAAATTVDGAAIADEKSGANWLSYGRTYSEQRYSPLKQITADNVGGLGVAWFMDLPGQKSLLSTPLVVDGILYFSGSYSVVFAVDTRTGKKLWTYDPKTIDAAGERLRVMWDSLYRVVDTDDVAMSKSARFRSADTDDMRKTRPLRVFGYDNTNSMGTYVDSGDYTFVHVRCTKERTGHA